MDTRISRSLTFAGAAAAIVLVTFIFRTFSIVNATTVGFVFLVTILLIAASWGLGASVLASVVATVSFHYFFLPPVGTWNISDPQNWVALFTFLISSLIASELSDRARRRTEEANTRQLEMERLYALSRSIMMSDAAKPIGGHVANEIARVCDLPAVAIYDRTTDEVHYGGSGSIPPVEARLKETVLTGSQSKDEKAGIVFAPISLGGQSIGSLAIQGGALSDTALQAVLNLMAISLENARSREIANRAQATEESERFKSTLLDGLAHEFKTPLTSIKAATTALLASSVSDAGQREELLTIVDQEAERLSRLVTEATRVARIEAGKVQMNRQLHSINRLVENVLTQTEPQRDGRSVDVSLGANMPPAYVDADLIQLALRQLVDNALKYSPRSSAVQVATHMSGEDFVVIVRNQGETIPESERSRVFEKFYRGQNVRYQVAGTGMGLPVARDILVAHGGDIYLHSSDQDGTEFVVTIPAGPWRGGTGQE